MSLYRCSPPGMSLVPFAIEDLFQSVNQKHLALQDAPPRFRQREPGPAIHFWNLNGPLRARWPFDLAYIAREGRRIAVPFERPGGHLLSSSLDDSSQIVEGAFGVKAGLLRKLALCCIEQLFAFSRLALGYGPCTLVLLSPERASGMDQQHLRHMIRSPEHQKTCAVLCHVALSGSISDVLSSYTWPMRGKPAVTDLYTGVRALIVSARQAVSRGVDLLQVQTNYDIGRRLVEQEQHGSGRAQYGKELLRELSDRLTAEFGPGFSRSNLEYMRRFYLTYRDRVGEKSQTLSGISGNGEVTPSAISQTASGRSPVAHSATPFTLSWSHYVFLLGMDDQERNFYEVEAAQQDWTLRELKRQFNAGLFERLALTRDPESIRELSKQGHQISKPEDLLKEPYVLEFLGLGEKASYSETELESAIVTHVERFLLELGKGFLFEARQKRFTFDEKHFFVDLVLYNRLLRCYVLIDLKIGKLSHQDLGQIQMYVNYFDRFCERQRSQNSTIGIVLCKKQNKALVEITLPKDANIHAREYQPYLSSKEELQRKLAEWIAGEYFLMTAANRHQMNSDSFREDPSAPHT